jgi:hypothetical protein
LLIVGDGAGNLLGRQIFDLVLYIVVCDFNCGGVEGMFRATTD